MGDMGDLWKDVKPEMKRLSKIKRAGNRKHAESELFMLRIPFLKKNDGAHLIVMPESSRRIDFWPGTGLWISHSGDRGRGIKPMLDYLRNLVE